MPVGKYNLPLMNKVMDKIEAEPDLHDQGVWSTFRTKIRTQPSMPFDMTAVELGVTPPTCGTAYCFAGHAVYEAGHEILYAVADYRYDENDKKYEVEFDATKTGDGRSIKDVAGQELGLDDTEMAILFAPDRTRYQLRELVDAANNGESLMAARERQLNGKHPTDW